MKWQKEITNTPPINGTKKRRQLRMTGIKFPRQGQLMRSRGRPLTCEQWDGDFELELHDSHMMSHMFGLVL